MTDYLKTRQKYPSPESSEVRDPGARRFNEEQSKTLFLIARDIYEDLKLLLTRVTKHQSVSYTPSQITAHQNNYDAGEGSLVRLSSDAARNITGILPGTPVHGTDGRRLTILNVGAQNIVLKHQDAASDAANRILSQTGADVTVAANGIAELIYDMTTARWRV